MALGQWILIDGVPIEVGIETYIEYERQMRDEGNEQWRRVAWTEIGDPDAGAGIDVSTVFLASDHSFTRSGPPVLWETMIFCKECHDCEIDDWQERYTSREAAEEGHRAAVALAQSAFDARRLAARNAEARQVENATAHPPRGRRRIESEEDPS